MSQSNGLYSIKKAPGARINIHNSGGKMTGETFNKSVVIEYPNEKGERILNQESLNNFNAIYIEENQVPTSLLSGGRRTRRLRRKSRKRRRTRRTRRKKR